MPAEVAVRTRHRDAGLTAYRLSARRSSDAGCGSVYVEASTRTGNQRGDQALLLRADEQRRVRVLSGLQHVHGSAYARPFVAMLSASPSVRRCGPISPCTASAASSCGKVGKAHKNESRRDRDDRNQGATDPGASGRAGHRPVPGAARLRHTRQRLSIGAAQDHR